MSDLNHCRRLAARLLAAGILLTIAGSAFADVRYVDVNSTNATPPYTNWSTAARNIQDAVDAAVAGDEVVVTNGTYSHGGRDYNRVEGDKPLSLRSVNGPEFTSIVGNTGLERFRCVYLTSGASLSGFTLNHGYAQGAWGGAWGGGALGGTLNNCTLTGNSALYGGGAYDCTLNNCRLTLNSADNGSIGSGGGAYDCTLNNCTLTGNSARTSVNFGMAYGGGAYNCTLNNCTLTGNSTTAGINTGGGGAASCTLNNCTVYFNFSTNGVNYDQNYAGGTLNYCCTTPDPSGLGNITNAPLFMDTNGWSNLRLQPNSPCINAGNNSYVTNATDLDGNPRISGGRVDIGAYEYQWPQLTIAPSGPNVLLRWPTNNAGYDYTGFTLQSTTNLGAVWSTNSPAPVVSGGQNVVTNPISSARQFYRLVQ